MKTTHLILFVVAGLGMTLCAAHAQGQAPLAVPLTAQGNAQAQTADAVDTSPQGTAYRMALAQCAAMLFPSIPPHLRQGQPLDPDTYSWSEQKRVYLEQCVAQQGFTLQLPRYATGPVTGPITGVPQAPAEPPFSPGFNEDSPAPVVTPSPSLPVVIDRRPEGGQSPAAPIFIPTR